MRFKVDENLPVQCVGQLREAGHDALSVNDQGLSGAPDPRIAEICLDERRVLVSLDLDRETMMIRKKTKFIHEGKYAAEVDVRFVVNEDEWSPHLTLQDAYKLDDVREALRNGDVKAAAKKAQVYELHPVLV